MGLHLILGSSTRGACPGKATRFVSQLRGDESATSPASRRPQNDKRTGHRPRLMKVVHNRQASPASHHLIPRPPAPGWRQGHNISESATMRSAELLHAPSPGVWADHDRGADCRRRSGSGAPTKGAPKREGKETPSFSGTRFICWGSTAARSALFSRGWRGRHLTAEKFQEMAESWTRGVLCESSALEQSPSQNAFTKRLGGPSSWRLISLPLPFFPIVVFKSPVCLLHQRTGKASSPLFLLPSPLLGFTMSAISRSLRSASKLRVQPRAASGLCSASVGAGRFASSGFAVASAPASRSNFSTSFSKLSGAPAMASSSREYDPEIKDIADYVANKTIDSELAVSLQ